MSWPATSRGSDESPHMIDSHEYRIDLETRDGGSAVVGSESDRLPQLAVASPPEFGGPGEVWSPEHLFVASVSSCLMTTFKAIAKNSRLSVLDYEDRATGLLVRGDDRLYRIERVELRPRVVIADEAQLAKAERLLTKAKSVCLISRSISSTVDLKPLVVAQESATRSEGAS